MAEILLVAMALKDIFQILAGNATAIVLNMNKFFPASLRWISMLQAPASIAFSKAL